jgi:hypothetical protein
MVAQGPEVKAEKSGNVVPAFAGMTFRESSGIALP